MRPTALRIFDQEPARQRQPFQQYTRDDVWLIDRSMHGAAIDALKSRSKQSTAAVKLMIHPDHELEPSGQAEPSNDRIIRHFLPVSVPTPWDKDGFLNIPPDGAWWVDQKSMPRAVSELANQSSSYVLLAAGGVGKTTVTKALRELEQNSSNINLKVLDKRAIRDEVARAIELGYPVYMDSLDEAALVEPAIFWILQELLSTSSAGRVPWRLACRPTAWNTDFSCLLRASLPEFSELSLQPLTKNAAAKLVRDVGINADEFLQALVDANLGRLSAVPAHLIFVARHWSTKGSLPSSHIDAMRFEVERLLAEPSASRPQPPILSTDRRLRIAGRLAAISLFSGANRFSKNAIPAPGLLHIGELPSDPEPDEPASTISPSQYEEVLSSALFDAAPDAAIAFRHQQYVEFLAANYMTTRGIKHAQIPALLGIHASGLLPGVMIGLAAWLAAINPKILVDLIPANALAFMQSGVEVPSDSVRRSVISALLARAAVGDIDPEWGIDLSVLVHDTLQEQLAEALKNGLNEPEQLWWISRLAHVGECHSVTSVLIHEVLAPRWPDWARRAGIATVTALAQDDELLQLKPMLHLNRDDDPDDEILAAVLDALYPRQLSIDEVLAALRPQRNRNLLGAYRIFLATLCDKLTPDDISPSLEWANTKIADGEDAYAQLIPNLIKYAWAQPEYRSIQEPFAGLVSNMISDINWYRQSQGGELPWMEGPAAVRRDLAILVSMQLKPERWYALLDWGLISSEDAKYLLQQVSNMPNSAQTILANCIPHLLHEPDLETAELVLATPETSPIYESTRWLRDPVHLASDTANRARRRRTRETSSAEVGSYDPTEHRTLLLSTLTKAEAELAEWWKVAYLLGVDTGNNARETVYSHDLTSRPGWHLLEKHEHHRIIDSGLRYVERHELQLSSWFGHKSITQSDALRDWSGVYLLTTLTRIDPERLRHLNSECWQRWAPAIIGAWNYDTGDDSRLRCDLLSMTPLDARPFIIDAALAYLDAINDWSDHLTSYALYEHLCDELASTLSRRLIEGRYSRELSGVILGLLAKHVPTIAASTCEQLRTGDLWELAYGFLAELDPQAVQQDLTGGQLALEVYSSIVSRLNITSLEEEQLVSLAQSLLDRLPISSDVAPDDDSFIPDVKYEARQTRTAVLHRLAELGRVEDLEHLLSNRPALDQKVISRFIRSARARAANLAFAHLVPAQVLVLLSRGDMRLVRHSGHLTQAVLSLLSELQHDITHKGAFRDLWNISRSGDSHPKDEDDISDWIARELENRLPSGLVVDRELQVMRHRQRGVGTRIDLTATAPTVAIPANLARVTIEAKLVGNRELLTAMHEQLAEQYIIPLRLQYGIYLVYWVKPTQRPSTWANKQILNRDDLMLELNKQAADFEREDIYITPYILDISRPD